VLIVEDDEATAAYLATALERAGFAVDGAGDAIAAERHLSVVEYDALLVDVGLPGPSGFDLVREMKGAYPDLPIAMMTANASLDVAVQAVRSSVDDFLVKPIDPRDLVELVDRLVRQGRIARTGAERVLAIGAHPDDVEIGVGGALLRHVFLGDVVAVVTLTQGDPDHGGRAGRARAERSAAMLGVRRYQHKLEPGRISGAEPTVSLLEDAVAEFVPTCVYTHSGSDLDRDHGHVHKATMAAATRIPALYCYDSPSVSVDFRPDRFVPVDQFLDAKVELLGEGPSSVGGHPDLDPELVRSTSRYWGRYGGSRYCEPLEVVRERVRVGAADRAGTAT
jgi:LmbE family N-acetylglucosaminyl deacetylase/CheY-like chemotaxis protein